jgi:ribosomal protein L37E
MSFCLCGNPSENLETGDCASCGADKRKAERNEKKVKEAKQFKKKIARFSKKRMKEIPIYAKESKEFLKGKRCAVFPTLMATDIHHMKGRIGFADEWARNNHITLLMDKRYWLAVSRPGHTHIELNPRWAREMGFSMERSEIVK